MSLLTDLFSTLDKRSLGGIADALGQPDQLISRGMQSAMGTVLGGMANHSDNPGMLRRMLDMAPSVDASWSNVTSAVAQPASPLITAGKRMLSTLFGGSEGEITRALGEGTGLQPGVTSSLLAMAAPMVLSFLGRKVRDEGMTMEGLGGLLQRELPAIRAALPASVTNVLWRREQAPVTSPVVAQSVTRERSGTGWILPLIIAALIPFLFWMFHQGRRTPAVPATTVPNGTANRAIPEPRPVPQPRSTTKLVVPSGVDLRFQTGSTKLQVQSQSQLNDFAAAMRANPDLHATVKGYTDNVGNPDSNRQLSQQRADIVKSDLVTRGVSADRITAEGHGDEDPIADNGTAEGRGMNRRVTVSADH